MCGHEWIKINDLSICKRCGITITEDKKILFDRKLSNCTPKNFSKFERKKK